VGRFTIESAINPDAENLLDNILSPAEWLDMPLVKIDEQAAGKILLGRKIANAGHKNTEQVALVDQSGRLAAIGRISDDLETIKPEKVFPS
jgi:hypothetical protein